MQAVLGICLAGRTTVTAGAPRPNRHPGVSGLDIGQDLGWRLAKLQVYTQQGGLAMPCCGGGAAGPTCE